MTGIVRAEGAELIRPRGENLSLAGGAKVYVYSGYGDWIGASRGQEAGYLRRQDVEILDGDALAERLRQAPEELT